LGEAPLVFIHRRRFSSGAAEEQFVTDQIEELFRIVAEGRVLQKISLDEPAFTRPPAAALVIEETG
jgi:hypothetical protein